MSKQQKFNWQALFDEQKRSGLTVVAFCKERNINPQTFYTRRYKLRKLNQTAPSVSEGDFIAVKRISTPGDAPQTITIQCGEVSILVPANVDMGQLATLVKGLR